MSSIIYFYLLSLITWYLPRDRQARLHVSSIRQFSKKTLLFMFKSIYLKSLNYGTKFESTISNYMGPQVFISLFGCNWFVFLLLVSDYCPLTGRCWNPPWVDSSANKINSSQDAIHRPITNQTQNNTWRSISKAA